MAGLQDVIRTTSEAKEEELQDKTRLQYFLWHLADVIQEMAGDSTALGHLAAELRASSVGAEQAIMK